MSESITIARPYAKAIFAHALDAKKLAKWSTLLRDLAQVVLDPQAIHFFSNPTSSSEQKSRLLLTVCRHEQAEHDDQKAMENLVALLSENKRLLLLPDIYALYELLRAEQEKTLTVEVISFSELTEQQKNKLIQSLSDRLQRQISLDVTINKSILGGAIIRAGDLVIDGSVQGKLNKLRSNLAA